ncbi:MAG: hypothetical protein AAGI24_10235 [Pseudomonadota bacterium]
MNELKEKHSMQAIEYVQPKQPAKSLKHQLVAAIARGDEVAAEELRMLLKLSRSENLRGSLRV